MKNEEKRENCFEEQASILESPQRYAEYKFNGLSVWGSVGEVYSIGIKCERSSDEHLGSAKPLTCSICSLSFTPDQRTQSLRTNVKPICDNCSETSLPQLDQRSAEVKTYTCKISGNSFVDRNNLIRHKHIHKGKKPLTCNFCSKSFHHKWSLIVHRRTHSGERPFTCNLCNKSFSVKGNLISHVRIHSSEKAFICEICSKGFNQSSVLIRHIRVHTGEKPFRCDICNIFFCSNSNLSSHRRRHTGEKPFSCYFCSKSFTDKRNLLSHINKKHNL